MQNHQYGLLKCFKWCSTRKRKYKKEVIMLWYYSPFASRLSTAWYLEVQPLHCPNISKYSAVHCTFWTVAFEIISSQDSNWLLCFLAWKIHWLEVFGPSSLQFSLEVCHWGNEKTTQPVDKCGEWWKLSLLMGSRPVCRTLAVTGGTGNYLLKLSEPASHLSGGL